MGNFVKRAHDLLPLFVIELEQRLAFQPQEQTRQELQIDVDPSDELLLADDRIEFDTLDRIDLKDRSRKVDVERVFAQLPVREVRGECDRTF